MKKVNKMIKDTEVVIMEKRNELRKLMIDFDNELDVAVNSTINTHLESTQRYVSKLKEPFLREIISSTQNNSLKNKYSASDILDVLEKVEAFLSNQKLGDKE